MNVKLPAISGQNLSTLVIVGTVASFGVLYHLSKEQNARALEKRKQWLFWGMMVNPITAPMVIGQKLREWVWNLKD